jgi:integrase
VVPDPFRETVKHYIWQVINHDDPQPRSRTSRRPSLSSVMRVLPRLTAFLHWLDAHGVSRIAEVTDEDLDRYAADVADAETTVRHKADLLVEVRRLWSYRTRLPEPMRLPASPPWGGESPSELLGGVLRPRENRTPRIASDTMETLLMWCLRFVGDLSDDVITGYHDYLRLWERTAANRSRNRGYGGNRTTATEAEGPLRAFLRDHQRTAKGLPGRTTATGTRDVDWPHLCRLFDLSGNAFQPGSSLRALVDQADLSIGENARLDTPITGSLNGQPWRTNAIGYAEAPHLADLLRTACLAVVTYLTGMRAGEVLNLERGCVDHDPVTGLWLINGRQWKGVRDHNGDKIPEGEQRPDPWVTIKQAADAVAVLERLHAQPLLFPSLLHPPRVTGMRSHTRPGQARSLREVPLDIANLINWVNAFCDANGTPDRRIPPDPRGSINSSRLRRTLAWHIVRRPRGLIAGAIQYGHLHVQLTLGYAGTYDSGFPDEHAYEDWLYRLDRLSEDHRRLDNGEQVSGPAADSYRFRVKGVRGAFAGRVLPTLKQARDMVSNPLLQIYPGRAMTCVFDPAKALCQLRTGENDVRRTPDQDDCRPNCQNIAYTDRDVADLRDRAKQLREVTDDHLAPSIRNHRERAELDRIRAIIRQHDHRR